MRKLLLLFVALCVLITAKAADSNYSLNVWEGGLEKIEGVVNNTLKFQTTGNPNIFVINVNNGDGQDLTAGAQFNFKIGDINYKNDAKTVTFLGGGWNKGGNLDGADDTNMSLGDSFKCVRIMLYFVNKDNYFINFQTDINDYSSPFYIHAIAGCAFLDINGARFQIDLNSPMYYIMTPGGSANSNSTGGYFYVKRGTEGRASDWLQTHTNFIEATNEWQTISPTLKKTLKLKPGMYYRAYLRQPVVDSPDMEVCGITVSDNPPASLRVAPEVKYDMDKGKNIFLGFKAEWLDARLEYNNVIKHKVAYKKNNVDQELIVDNVFNTMSTAILYGIDSGDISVTTVYTNETAGIEIISKPATFTYTPTNVLMPVAIDAPRQLKRYGTADDSNTFSSTLSWAAPSIYPVSGYDIMQADATNATPAEADYKISAKVGENYQFTALSNFMIEGITNIKDADPVKVNYIVIPRYNIGNTVMTTISDADYSKTTDIAVMKPAFADITPVTAEFTKTLVPTGVEGIESGKTSVYPNPTTGAISITATEAINEVALYNLSGGLVAKFNGGGESSLNIDITDTSAGTYFLKVGSQVTKIIKK